ncbi:MAG: hypothetical protein NTY22_04015 [Proteobacteria bacterium]|nr:hypothetical protein [Pseudomonadota bacterium]
MNTFRGRILFAGIIAILIGSILLFYSIYRVSILNSLTEEDKSFYMPVAREVAGLGGLFQSHQFNINKIISEPARYNIYDIQNNPLKDQIETEIEKISRVVVNFYSKSQDQDIKKYLDNIDSINKSFRDYNLAAIAIIQAFASENKQKDQGAISVEKFFTIIKDSEASISTSINVLADSFDEKITLGSVNIHHYFNTVIWLLFIIWVLDIVFIVWMLVYSGKVSNYLLSVSDSVSKIKGDQFNPEDISNSIPIYDENDLFELANKVTRLAKSVHEDTSGYKDRISYLENDNTRQKIIATYTTSILNSINVAVMVTDSLLKVSFINAEFEKMWKMKKNSVVDVDIMDLPFIKLIDDWKEALSKTNIGDSKKDMITFKGEFKISSKTKRNLEFQIMPLKDNSSRDIIGTMTIVRESTPKH